MKKLLMGALCSLLLLNVAKAQNKVFKEVGDDMSSTMEAIIHDDQLVGYLRFIQLEKASKDSFNYRIDIMDENLNDMGSVKFRDEQLNLQSVAFEQDVLCLAYLKSNIIGTEFKNRHSYKNSLSGAKNAVVMQFITLDGKILNTHAYNVNIALRKDAFSTQYYGNYQLVFTQFIGYGDLKHPLQVTNIPQQGFACFYGDAISNHLLRFNVEGKEHWQKTIPMAAKGFTLHASGDNIYLLAKRESDYDEGGFEMLAFSSTGNEYKKVEMKDKKGNALKVLSLGNDPVSGKPFLSGYIIDPERGNKHTNTKDLARGPYIGVFSMNLNDPAKGEVEEVYSYWNDGSQMPVLSKKGYNYKTECYTLFSKAFHDNNGNTYFVGSAFDKKTRWGTITTSVILSPLVFVSPYLLYAFGTQKSTLKDITVLRQSPDGKLTFERPLSGNNVMYFPAKVPMNFYNNRRFYHATNTNTHSNYLVVNDVKDVIIYNVEQKKIARTIPHRKGSIYYNVLPAKEGHVLVTQYNAKERSTNYSIEAL